MEQNFLILIEYSVSGDICFSVLLTCDLQIQNNYTDAVLYI